MMQGPAKPLGETQLIVIIIGSKISISLKNALFDDWHC